MEHLTKLIAFVALAASLFTLSSCATAEERFEARQQAKIDRIERRQDRYDAEQQWQREDQDRQVLKER